MTHADNSAHLRAAARRRHAATRRRALAALDTHPAPTTVAGLARAAGVARSWIYNQPDILARIRAARVESAAQKPTALDAATPPTESRHRPNPNLAAENARLRHQLAAAHRQLHAAQRRHVQ